MTRYALVGRVVTMNDALDVLPQGVVYVENKAIKYVRPLTASPPDDFRDVPQVDTGGTIYPGLIELHNHISYNVLPLWAVPRQYEHRAQWASAPAKRKLISGPMTLLTEKLGYVEAVVRYVECKCLLAGVTTTQGVTLSSEPGIEERYRGIVRNVEATGDPSLPEAGHKIADVEDAAAFKKALEHSLEDKASYFLHLSEGITEPGKESIARQHFLNLKCPDGTWAINGALAGIHSAGLEPADFDVMAEHGGSMVWSPLSNLLLYHDTAKVAAARASGVRIALGSDWSPTGSKNLLGELKMARVFSNQNGDLFTDRDLVAMATIEAARILKWDQVIGSLEPGKRADLVVIDGQADDQYRTLLAATESDVSLVMIDGTPRYGLATLMDLLAVDGESWQLAGEQRRLNLADSAGDPVVGKLTLAEAEARLRAGLQALPYPPDVVEAAPIGAAAPGEAPKRWRLVLDNDGPEARTHRPLAPLTTAEVIAAYWAASVPLEEVVEPVQLDRLTVAEDPEAYFARLRPQLNLLDVYKQELPKLYGL